MSCEREKHPLDILWAPWRMKYIMAGGQPSGCIFCLGNSAASDRENHVLCRYESCFAMLNRFPYNNGHILIAPYEHIPDLEGLSDEQLLDIMRLLRDCKRALAGTMSPEGFNVGLNLGSAAGAGVEEHVHLHIVPRWRGDTNFMTVTGRTKVIPQSLDDAYEVLHEALSRKQR